MSDESRDEGGATDGSGDGVTTGSDDGGLVARLPDDLLATLVVALLAGLGAVAGSYAVAGRTPAFVAAPVSRVFVALTPGEVITFSITVLGDLGTLLAYLTAVGLTVVLFGAAAGVGAALGRRFGSARPPAGALGSVLVVGGLAVVLTGAPLSALAAAVASGVVVGLPRGIESLRTGTDDETTEAPIAGRRTLLGSVATALGIGVAGYLLGERATSATDAVGSLDETDGMDGAGGDGTGDSDGSGDGDPSTTDELLALADERSLGVAGIEPLVSEEFYTVDINSIDPTVDGEAWTLSVTGAVDEEVEYTYDDLTSMDREHHFVTLRCVGEKLNGHKMDNALWTGVPIADLIEPAGVQGEYVMLRAADGFYEEFPVDALWTGFLAFGMNGNALPRAHGRPARALIPGHWGEINVKWITEIEILEQEADGYWEERGWHGTGPVNTVAKLHATNYLDDGRIEVAGHAYAGTRGIEKVEVSFDRGETWDEADLSEPLPGEDVWRQWVYRYERDGEHDVTVRAVDGTGTVQPQDRMAAYPSGATGWVAQHVENDG